MQYTASRTLTSNELREKSHSTQIRKKTRLSTLCISIQYRIQSSNQNNKKAKDSKGIQIGIEESYNFYSQIIRYISDPKGSTKDLPHLINTFSYQAEYKINSKSQYTSYIQMIKQAKEEIRETPHFIVATMIKNVLGVNLPKQVKDLYDKSFEERN